MPSAADEFARTRAELGANIHRRRKSAKLTQAALAEKVGVTVEHLRGVERGSRSASLALVAKLAVVFGVRSRELFTPGRKLARNPGRPPSR